MKKWFFAGLVTLMCSPCSWAQTPTSSHTPKIALVLEGGGALGLAHIGVIDWLEQHHIPINYVAGTSMGGFVGGFYATGRSPSEMRAIVKTIKWDSILGDKLPYQDLTYRRKEDQRSFPNFLEFGIADGIRFPSGFSPGHQVGLFLDREMYAYSDVKSFDELPIPFRCVGVDLVSRKEKIFNDGSLSKAMRATMSIPAVFSPVRTADAIYVDGGLLNNLPIDVARSMGADLVIAVHLRTKPFDQKQLLSSVGVLSQSVSVVIAVNELRNMENADILITVDMSTFSSSDYKKADELIDAGMAAADRKSAVLLPLALDEQQWTDLIAARKARKPASPNVPSFIRAKTADPAMAKNIEKQLSSFVGRPLNFPEFEKELDRLVGSGRYSQVGYEQITENGELGLLIKPVAKDYAPPIVNPLVEVDGSEYRDTAFMAGARFTFFDIGVPGSEWRNDVLLGSEYSLASEYYRPLSAFGKWFVAPSVELGSKPFDLYSQGDHVAQYRMQGALGGLDLGYAINRISEVRVGYSGGYSRFYRVIGDQKLGETSGRVGRSTVRFTIDGLDSPLIPRKGWLATAKSQWHDALPGANDPFASLEIRTVYVKPVSVPASVFVDLSSGSTLGMTNSGVPLFSLGGTAKLSAYGRNELLANQYWLGRFGYLHRLMKLPPLLGSGMYATGTYEIGKPYGLNGGPTLPMDGSAGLVLETAFGPLFLGGSVGDGGHRKLLFRLGRFF